LFPVRATRVSTRPILDAAQGFLATLDATPFSIPKPTSAGGCSTSIPTSSATG
jgi:hypothetical protein